MLPGSVRQPLYPILRAVQIHRLSLISPRREPMLQRWRTRRGQRPYQAGTDASTGPGRFGWSRAPTRIDPLRVEVAIDHERGEEMPQRAPPIPGFHDRLSVIVQDDLPVFVPLRITDPGLNLPVCPSAIRDVGVALNPPCPVREYVAKLARFGIARADFFQARSSSATSGDNGTVRWAESVFTRPITPSMSARWRTRNSRYSVSRFMTSDHSKPRSSDARRPVNARVMISGRQRPVMIATIDPTSRLQREIDAFVDPILTAFPPFVFDRECRIVGDHRVISGFVED